MAEVMRDVGTVSWSRWFARIVGIVLVLIGIWGFFTPDPLGINFELTTLHNWVHILTGLVALYFGFATNLTVRAIATFAVTVGAIYLLLGIVGFFVVEIAGLVLTLADNWLHILIGVAGLGAGFADFSVAGTEVRGRRPAV